MPVQKSLETYWRHPVYQPSILVGYLIPKQFLSKNNISTICGGARGVMVIVVGIGHGDTSSNPGPDWLHFT